MATKIYIKNSSVEGKVPDAGALDAAELAINLKDQKLYSKDADGNVFELGRNTAGETPSGGTTDRPGSPNVGDIFYDTDLDILIYWNGSEWVEVGSGGSEVIVAPNPPATADLEEGTLWWNNDASDLNLYVLYNDPDPDAGLKWIEACPGGGGGSVDGDDFVKLNDGATKQVIESAGLGISDGSTENLTLKPDGGADFATGKFKITGGTGQFECKPDDNVGKISVTYSGGVDNTLKLYGDDKDGNREWELGADGRATFAGTVKKDTFDNTSSSGYGWRLDNSSNSGQLDIDCASAANDDARVFGVYKGTTNTIKFEAGGSASFAGNLEAKQSFFTTQPESAGALHIGLTGESDYNCVIHADGSANFGDNADWAGGFFNIRKPDNNWAQMISIDSTSAQPTGLFIGCGADSPTTEAILITKNHTGLGGSSTVNSVDIDWNGNAKFGGAVQSFAPSTSLFAAAGAAADGSTPVFVVRHSATGPTNGTDAFYVYSNGTYTTVSDRKQKKNIETTRDGYLEDLNKLRVVKYNWRSQGAGAAKELGLIAQEVERVFPGLVAPMGEDENGEPICGVKSSVLPFILIKALQEADDKIGALEARLAELEKRLS